MNKITIEIDKIPVKVLPGTTIINAAKKIGIAIPTLCYHKDLSKSGICRICVVEIDDYSRLQTSCSYAIEKPIRINTFSSKIKQTRKDIIELLLSECSEDCKNCTHNNFCQLRILANKYGCDRSTLKKLIQPKHYQVDNSDSSIVFNRNKCIQCRQCINTCDEIQNINTLTTYGRGNKTKVTTFMDKSFADSVCINCGQCVIRCPTGALSAKSHTNSVWDAIYSSQKHVVIQTAPAPRSSIGELFGLKPGTSLTFELNTALRYCGFDKVFDTTFSADLAIIEAVTELLLKLYNLIVKKDHSVALPQFSSCCPSWIKFVEYFYPEFIPNLSTDKSPQQMLGALIKTYYAKQNKIDPKNIVSVSLMPCTAKKFESVRPEMNSSGFKDIDYSLTTLELANMLTTRGVDLVNLSKSNFDNPFGPSSGSGVIFGTTGGVMEAALRTIIELVEGIKVENIFKHANIQPVRGFKETRYAEFAIKNIAPVPKILKNIFKDWQWLKDKTLKVGVCHGISSAKKVMEDIKSGGRFSKCHFIEVMACPGGCLGGGGQPIPTTNTIRNARAKAIYSEDRSYTVRKAHENPSVIKLYKEFLNKNICTNISKKLLHTHYKPRKL